MTYGGHPDQRWGYISYAQHGDDFMLLSIFEQLGWKKGGEWNPTYLDLGAHHPTIISNTRLLYENGFRGVNVEANLALIPAFKEERPEDVTLNVGVGLEDGEAEFYMFSPTSGLNTFSPDEVKRMAHIGPPKTTITLPVRRLATIVEASCPGGRFPDLLLCDIEGLDYDVLASAPFDRLGKPKVICVEVRPEASYAIVSMLNQRGFGYYCRMGENCFFVDDSQEQIWGFK